MHNLSDFRIKVFVCGLIFILILAVTGLIVFAAGSDQAVASQPIQPSPIAEFSSKDASGGIPVVVLDDGKASQVVSLDDFLKLVKNSKSGAVVPAAQVKNMKDLVRLQNEIMAGNEQIKLFEKLIEKMDKKTPQDSWWKEGWKEGLKIPKGGIRAAGVFLMKALVGGAICGAIIIAGTVITYKIFILPVWCWSGIPSALSYFHSWGMPIKSQLYEACDSYYEPSTMPKVVCPSTPLNVPVNGLANVRNVDGCNCDAEFLSTHCVGACFPG